MKMILVLIGFALMLVAISACAQKQKTFEEKVLMLSDIDEIRKLQLKWGLDRDKGNWEGLTNSFSETGRISLSWIDASNQEFVNHSKKLADNQSTSVKHLIGSPVIDIVKNRAVSETNVTIMLRAVTPFGEVDSASYARFYDQLEKINGSWKIIQRTAIYEKDELTFTEQNAIPKLFYENANKFPEEVKFLATILQKNGVKLSDAMVLDKSENMRKLYIKGNEWLHSAN